MTDTGKREQKTWPVQIKSYVELTPRYLEQLVGCLSFNKVPTSEALLIMPQACGGMYGNRCFRKAIATLWNSFRSRQRHFIRSIAMFAGMWKSFCRNDEQRRTIPAFFVSMQINLYAGEDRFFRVYPFVRQIVTPLRSSGTNRELPGQRRLSETTTYHVSGTSSFDFSSRLHFCGVGVFSTFSHVLKHSFVRSGVYFISD